MKNSGITLLNNTYLSYVCYKIIPYALDMKSATYAFSFPPFLCK